MPDLEITATGNVTGAVTALDKVQASLAKTAVSSAKLDSTLAKTSTALNTGLKNGANQATGAMINLGRVVQDAPFGFIGIANNLNPLLESFQRLKAETGSTGLALKALAGSILGAGGLGFAISIVSAALSIFSLNSRGAGGSAEDLSGKIAALKVDFDNAKESADNFNTSINSLRSLRDVNLAIRFPGDGANALKRLSLGFGFNLVEEQEKLNQLLRLEKYAEDARRRSFNLLQDKGSKALDNLISSELNLNEVKKKGTELSSKDLQLLDAAIDAERKKVDIQGQQQVQRNKINQLIGQNKLDIDDINKKEAERIANIRTISDVLSDMNKQLRFLGAKEDILNTDESKGKLAALRSAFDELVKDFRLTGSNPIIIDIVARVDRIEYDQLAADFKLREFEKLKSTGDNIKRQTVSVPVIVKPKITFIDPVIDKDFEAFAQRINGMLEGVLEESFAGLGEAIAAAISGGSVEGIFDGLISSLGEQLKELGKFLIQTGIVMETAKKALKALFTNPLAQVVAGVALVALGALLQASVRKKAPGFATGVRDFQGGGVVTVGERGPERIFLPKHSTVQPNNEMTAYGGGGVTLQPSIAYDGTMFRIFLNRVDAQMGRTN